MAVRPQRIVGFIVRSELIFRAREKIDNKYELCQATAKSTRVLHIPTTSATVTINDALTRLAGDRVSPALASLPLVGAQR
jgi:hypothetical protein